MKLCGETLLFLNAAIDTGLLVCSARLCGEQFRWGRMILAGVLGGAYAVAAVLPGGDFLRHGLVKASMAAAICLVAFGASARYFRLTAVYCAMGCLFAGLVLAFTQLTGTGLLRLPGGGFYPVSAMALLSIGALCLAIVRLMFAGSIQHTARSYETLELRLGENMVSLRALIDTGNTLKDPMTNEPVLVLDWSAAARLLPESNLREQDFLHPAELMRRLMLEHPGLRARLVPYRAVGVSQGLLLAVGVCQFLPQGRQVVVGDTGGGGAGPDQVQDVAAHGSRHPVVHGMVPVQAQSVGHPGHIAVFGVTMVVFLHIIALGGAGKVGVLQAHTGGDAVAQGNIGVGIFLCCKGRQDRQHQQSQGQQQADNTFFHKEPPCIASSEKDHFSRAFKIWRARYLWPHTVG